MDRFRGVAKDEQSLPIAALGASLVGRWDLLDGCTWLGIHLL